MKVSIVVPVYNEAENIRPLTDEILALDAAFEALELLFVDDASTDDTAREIDQCHALHPHVKRLSFTENRGQSAAMLTGMRAANYEVIVTLDGDLQNDPADIPTLTAALDNVDVVCGRRRKRKDSWSKRTGSIWANKVRNRVTKDGVSDTGCSLKAFRSKCVADLPTLEGVHRFMPAYFKLNGRTITEIDVNHRARRHGESKYSNLGRLPRTLLDLWGFWWFRKRFLRLDGIATEKNP